MTITLFQFVRWLVAVSVLAPMIAAQNLPGNLDILFAGTYTAKDSKGIYAYRFDAPSGELTPLGLAAETANPSFLAIDRTHRYLYAVNEVQNFEGAKTGAVSAFTIDGKTGKLSLLNQVASEGADPCYVSFDKTGKYLLVANYTGGTVAVFPIQKDGRLSKASSVMYDKGALGPNKERQDAPHSHWIEASSDNRSVYVSDLGLDRVLVYGFDAANGKLRNEAGGVLRDGKVTAGGLAAAVLTPGTGPRHVAFSQDGNFMYVLGELDSNVSVFAVGEKHSFDLLQRISALPAGFSSHNDAAEIAVHPNGKYLYSSNRGDDSIAAFSIDGKSGNLTLIGRFPTQGKVPRHFEIDPSGNFLLVANQESNNVVVFRLDPNSGKLAATGQQLTVPSPVCLKFMSAD